jgi:hypothetical protein
LLAFFRVVYGALQLGAAHMAAQASAPWPDDARRLLDQMERYRMQLRARLQP